MWRRVKLRGALTTNSHSNESKCRLMERILEKTAQHGFISVSGATERSAHHRRQSAIKVGKTGSFPTHGGTPRDREWECAHHAPWPMRQLL